MTSVQGTYLSESIRIRAALLDVVSSEDITGNQAISILQAGLEPVCSDSVLQQHNHLNRLWLPKDSNLNRQMSGYENVQTDTDQEAGEVHMAAASTRLFSVLGRSTKQYAGLKPSVNKRTHKEQHGPIHEEPRSFP